MLIDIPDLTVNDDEELVAVRKKYTEVIREYRKNKRKGVEAPTTAETIVE